MDNKAFSSEEDEQQMENGSNSNRSRPPSSSSSSASLSSRNYRLQSPTPSSRDEAFEDITSSMQTHSETQPININRKIFYTEDFYTLNAKNLNSMNSNKNNRKSYTFNNDNDDDDDDDNNNYKNNGVDFNHKKSKFSLIDSVRNVFKCLLPPTTQPRESKSKSIIVVWMQTLFPILHWLPNYQWKTYLVNDVIAGCTILALHIPQGLAYSRLAGVEPIIGLYVSLFPVLIYALLGTGRQVSIGTFAVISIACKDALQSFELNEAVIMNLDANNSTTTALPPIDQPNAIDILTTLALFVGLIQFSLGFLQLGIMSIILSETLISAFVVACSIHVFTSQIFALLNISSSGEEPLEEPIPFDLIKSWLRFLVRIPETNLITLAVSVSSIATLIACKYGLEPFIMKKFKLKNVVIPIDILLIIFTTTISSFLNLHQNFGVEIIPRIPKAFQGMPKVPDMSYFLRLYPSAILITFVSFVSTYSLGKMYGKQHGYEVSANQELIAIGAANFVSSFFLCYPCSGSLARSAVMDKVGAKTQMASIVSCLLMVMFLLFFSGFLHTLPKAVLSCIIVVALYSTMKQIRQFKTAWHASKLDGVLWISTFTLVILFGVGKGLLYSVLFSFIILILQLIIPTIKLKRQVDNSEVFMEISHIYDNYDPLTGKERFKSNQNQSNRCVVFEFQGPLIFINSILLKRKFHDLIGKYLIAQRNKVHEDSVQQKNHPSVMVTMNRPSLINKIIFDCTRLTYIDAKGVETLLETISNSEIFGAKMALASCSQIVFDNLKKNGFFDKFNIRNCYMSVVDAIADIEHS